MRILECPLMSADSPKSTAKPIKGPKDRSSHLKTSPARISNEEACRALRRSGYLLEYRVESYLRKLNWYVEANSAYEDPETKKSREVDLYALTALPLNLQDHQDRLFSSVLVECVNAPQPIALITKKPVVREWAVEDIKVALDPNAVTIDGSDDQVSTLELLKIGSYHHYCTGRIATQFCSFKQKSDRDRQWMAWHDETHFGAFNSLVKALEYRFSQIEKRSGTYINWEFVHPVVVLQGDLLDVRCSGGGSVSARKAEHLKYRRTVIWNGEERGYIIDVVKEKAFPRFLAMLETELRRTVFRVRRHAELVKSALRLKYSEAEGKPIEFEPETVP